MTMSRSPERGSFSRDMYEKQLDEGKIEQEEFDGLIDMLSDWDKQRDILQSKPEWKINNLEYDLRTTDWILEKVRKSDLYAQHLYASLCNVDWQKLHEWPILKGESWGCSWRHAGGIIADMQEKGDYIDWYCSGIRGEISDEDFGKLTDEQKANYNESKLRVCEGVVTGEIREDLKKLGWQVFDERS